MPSLQVFSLGQMAEITALKLIVLEEGPADIIIGLETLRENNIFGKLSRYFGTGSEEKASHANSPGDRTVSERRCIEPRLARKSDRTSLNTLSIDRGTANQGV